LDTKQIAPGRIADVNGAQADQRAASGEVAAADASEESVAGARGVSSADSALPAEASFSQARAMREDEIDLLDLLIALARRKRLIAGATVGGAVLAAVISFLIPNRYTATTKVLPPQQAQSSAAMLMTQLAGSGLGPLAAVAGKDLGLKNPNDIYIGMLKSRTVEDALIAQFALSGVYREKKISDTRKELEKASDIVSSKEGLIEISVEDKSPQRAAALANSYVEQLRKLTQHLAVSEASQRRLFFEQQVEQAKSDLGTAELALKNTEQKTGMIHLDAQARAVIEAVGTLRAQIAASEVELQGMRSFATDQNPDVILRERQVAAWREQLANLEQHQATSDGDPILSTGKMPATLLEYKTRFREAKYRETIFELMAKQFEAAKLDEAKEAAIIQVVDPAVEPDRKSSPKRVLIILISTIAGFFLSAICALLTDAFGRAEKHPMYSAQIAALRSSLSGRNDTHLKSGQGT
jgi:tyrosine-protein kinase Etk/Wzc